MNDSLAARIREHTVVAATPLVPELRLHLVTDQCALWHATEAQAAAVGLPEPYWAFCWPGGQALARHVLDHPDLVRDRRVVDFGSGCAVEALAALKAGAKSVLAVDIDPVAAEAARLNAALNGLEGLATSTADLIGAPLDCDVVLAGDVFYDTDLAARGRAWLESLARQGILVLVGDPKRGFLDVGGLEPVATYRAGADGELAPDKLRDTQVFRVPG